MQLATAHLEMFAARKHVEQLEVKRMEQITIRLVLGCGLTAIGALVLAERRATADAFVFLSVGTAILAVACWMWLEWERDRLLRWSKEHRVAAVARVIRPEKQPENGTAIDGLSSPLAVPDCERLRPPRGQVGVGRVQAAGDPGQARLPLGPVSLPVEML